MALAPFGINIDAIRTSRLRFARAIPGLDPAQAALGGALAAAITARLFELAWIEHGPRPRTRAGHAVRRKPGRHVRVGGGTVQQRAQPCIPESAGGRESR